MSPGSAVLASPTAMVRAERSRSPVGAGTGGSGGGAGTAQEDVAAAHRLRESYGAPKQSKFRVASVLRFVRPDGTHGVIEAVNAEPHDANIRGAICAERACMCRFQREEAGTGARVVRVVCVTDNASPIYPGPLCREFLNSTCPPETEVVASGSGDVTGWVARPLGELLPLPSVYRHLGQDEIKALAARLGSQVKPPLHEGLAAAYASAVTRAKGQAAQAHVFPILFAAAVRFNDGRLHVVSELKGAEYGCTVDAVSLLLPEMIRSREEGAAAATCIVQADQFGLAHAPFAGARALIIEHGFGDVLVSAHGDDGEWASPISARDVLPHADFADMLS